MTTIDLDGIIGYDIDARDIRVQLPESGTLTLRINTPGGLVDEGIAITNELRAFRRNGGTVTASITGQCCSMGTYIAMAADRIEVEDNAVWMVHNPSTLAWGDHHFLAKAARTLESVRSVIARAYIERSARPEVDILAEMDEETWLFGEEIVTAGYADALIPAGDGPESHAQAVALAQTSFRSMLGKLKTRQSDPAQLDQIAALLPSPTAGPAGPHPRGTSMTYQEQVNAALGLPASASAEQATAALSALQTQASQAARDEAFGEGHTAGVNTERARIVDILTCEEAKGREPIAINLARVDAMNAESAAAVLAALPASAPPPPDASPSEQWARSAGSELRAQGATGAAPAASWDAVVAKINQQRG